MIQLQCPKCGSTLGAQQTCPSCQYAATIVDGDIYSFLDTLDTPDLQLSQEKWEALYAANTLEALEQRFDEYQRTYFEDTYQQLNAEKRIKDSVYLEIGCGEFFLGSLIANECRLIVGVDFSLSALRMAKRFLKKRKIKNYLLIHADINHLPIADNQIDIIYGGGVIEHFDDTKTILSELLRVLKKGGISFNTVPALNVGAVTYRQVWGNIPNVWGLKQALTFLHVKLLGGKHMIFGYEMSFLKGTLHTLHTAVGFKQVKVKQFKVQLLFNFLPAMFKKTAVWLTEHTTAFSPMYKVIGTK